MRDDIGRMTTRTRTRTRRGGLMGAANGRGGGEETLCHVTREGEGMI